MEKNIVYDAFHLNTNSDEIMEHPDSKRLLMTTGYEKISKTVDRLMVAGLNLYEKNRNAEYEIMEEEEEINGSIVSKYIDEKTAKMRMREIQRRLREKVKKPEIIEEEVIEENKIEEVKE